MKFYPILSTIAVQGFCSDSRSPNQDYRRPTNIFRQTKEALISHQTSFQMLYVPHNFQRETSSSPVPHCPSLVEEVQRVRMRFFLPPSSNRQVLIFLYSINFFLFLFAAIVSKHQKVTDIQIVFNFYEGKGRKMEKALP